MRFDLISNSIKRRHNKINTHVMYLIHSSQKTKLYLKQIPNGHDEMATGDHSRKMSSWSTFTFAFDFSSALVFDMLLIHTFVHTYESVKAAIFLSMSTNVFIGGVIRNLANFESLSDTICKIRHCFM